MRYQPAFIKRLASQRRRRAWDLTALLNAADGRAPRPYRHLWLIRLMEWIRGDADKHPGTRWPLRRIQHLLSVLERNPVLEERVALVIGATLNDLNQHRLWSDFGFAPRSAFLSELSERLKRLFLPGTPDTEDLGQLIRMMFKDPRDIEWLMTMDAALLARIAGLLKRHNSHPAQSWLRTASTAITSLAIQVCVSGTSMALAQRMDTDARQRNSFHELTALATRLEQLQESAAADDLQHIVSTTRATLKQCRESVESIYRHLNEYGISVDVIFEVYQVRERTRRIDQLLDTLVNRDSAEYPPLATITHTMAGMLHADQQRRGIRALFAHHYSMLARKVAQRSGDIGAHYITNTRSEYLGMLRMALIGGAVLAGTTFMKFMVQALGLSLFWNGLLAGINYAVSFVIIFLLHGTVATKQPAMTAAALAGRLQYIQGEAELQTFVSDVARLIRSQIAGIAGNLLAVTPLVLLVQLAYWQFLGMPAIGMQKAEHILHDHTLLGPSLLYAALTGVILFVGSLIAGWTENWFLWHRIDSAMAWNPHFINVLGSARAQRWAAWWRKNISSIASNVSLGLMLGVVPVLLQFFGIPFEVRHVTLVTGQVMAAAGTIGLPVLHSSAFWWTVATIPFIGICNLTVSFVLALRVAVRARGIQVNDQRRIFRAVGRRLLRHPLQFVFPPRQSAHDEPSTAHHATGTSRR